MTRTHILPSDSHIFQKKNGEEEVSPSSEKEDVLWQTCSRQGNLWEKKHEMKMLQQWEKEEHGEEEGKKHDGRLQQWEKEGREKENADGQRPQEERIKYDQFYRVKTFQALLLWAG